MLYITTRSAEQTFASRCTLKDSYAPDGGHFVPQELTHLGDDAIASFREKSFGSAIAEILNVFFPNQLNGWDVDFCIGRNVIKMITMSHRVAVAELWHNLDNHYTYIVRQLYKKIRNCGDDAAVTPWFSVAAGTAILFGVYSEMLRAGILHINQTFDIALICGDFSAPISAFYARRLGLPIETIICTSQENSPVWDLIQRGSFNTAIADTDLSLGIERLIHETVGSEQVQIYRQKNDTESTYFVPEEILPVFNSGLFCSVPGETRASAVINSVYRTSGYLTDPVTALCYGSMQDYRARTGESRVTLLLSMDPPHSHCNEIHDATGLSRDEILKTIN